MKRQNKGKLIAAALVGVPSLFVSQAAKATAYTWTGVGDGTTWGNNGNWTSSPAATFPNGVSDTATFGAGGASITLGGNTYTAQSLTYAASATSFNIGITAGDTITLGAVTNAISTATSGSSQTVSANLDLSGASTFTLKLASGSTFDIAGNISDASTPGMLTLVGASANGTMEFDGANTYSGGTLLNNGNIFKIGSNAQYNVGGSLISGALGTGTVSAISRPVFMAVNANRTLGNALIIGGASQGLIVTNAASAFSMTFAGAITNNIANKLYYEFDTPGQTTTFGTSGTTATWTLSSGTAGNQTQINLSGNSANQSTLVLNYIIQDPAGGGAGIAFNNTGTSTTTVNNGTNNAYTVLINGASTYSTGANDGYGTQFNGSNAVYQIGISSTGGLGTNATSGPFGIGVMAPNNSATPPTFTPHLGNRTLNNAVTLANSGFIVANDASGTYNLTFAGPIGLTVNRTVNNNMNSGAALYLGLATNPSTITLGGTSAAQLQIQTNGFSSGSTVINDVIQNASGGGAGNLVLLSGGPVYLNANNTYTGATRVLGAGTSSAAVGTGGTLAGTGWAGSSGGTVYISTNTAGNYGGILAPGSATATAGTINAPSMQWNPYGRYIFDHDGTLTTAGGGVNDLVSGIGNLDLTNLSSSTAFDLNLNELDADNGSPKTYTLAAFGNGITSGGINYANGAIVTSDFTFSGAEAAENPVVTVVADTTGLSGTDPQDLDLTLTPTPEPSGLLFLGLAAGMLSRRRRRRQ